MKAYPYVYLLLTLMLTGFSLSKLNAQSCTARFYEFPDSSLTSTFYSRDDKVVSPGYIKFYSWDFGDGDSLAYSGRKKFVTHTYPSYGWYEVTLNVWTCNILRDTVCSDTYIDSIPVGFIYQNGCNANLHLGTDTINSFYISGVDSTSYPMSNTLTYDYAIFHSDLRTSTLIQGSATSHSVGNSKLFRLNPGRNDIYLYKQLKEATGPYVEALPLVCEDVDHRQVYVIPGINAWSSISSVVRSQPHGVVDFSCTYGSPGLDTTIHQQEFSWTFGDGDYEEGKNPTHQYTKPGTYTVELSYWVIEKGSGKRIGQGISYDTVVIGTTPTCAADFGFVGAAGTKWFKNLSQSFYDTDSTYVHYFWDFGDGTSSTGANPSHNFSLGTYSAQLIVVVENAYGGVLCSDSIVKQIRITPNPQPAFCDASFSIDTVRSQNAVLYIRNNARPTLQDTFYQSVDYKWDFGDGTTSNLSYPSHHYPKSGLYNLCLKVEAVNNWGDSCTSTFCDSIGMDSLGNFIRKVGASGFTVNIFDPNRVDVKEHALMDARVYPNPATDAIYIESLHEESRYALYDLSGRMLNSGRLDNDVKKPQRISLNGLPKGLYILNITSGNKRKSIKLMIAGEP